MKKINFLKMLALSMVMLFGLSNTSFGQYAGTGTFTRITSLTDLTDGYYVIAHGTTIAMKNTNAGSFFDTTHITPTTNVITDPSVAIVWKIETNGNAKTIYNEAVSRYVLFRGTANAAQTATTVTDSARWTFDYVNNLFEIRNVATNARYLKYNSATPRFACYTSGQNNLALYKMSQTTNAVTVTPSKLTFENLLVYKTTSKTINVSATDLEGDLTVAVGGNGFSCATTTITNTEALAIGGKDITVVFAPTSAKLYQDTLIISGEGLANPIKVTLSGSGVNNYNLFEDFETITANTAYTPRSVDLKSGKYLIAGIANLTDTNDRRIDTRSIRFRGNTTSADTVQANFNRIEMEFDKPNGIGVVSFKYASYSNHTGGVVYVEYSTDQGKTWEEFPNNSVTAPAWNKEIGMLDANVVVNVAGNARIRIIKYPQTGSKSVNIDNLAITDYDPENMVAATVFSKSTCNLYQSTDISITCATTGAEIRYTTDNTEPTGNSILYEDGTPIIVNETQTLKAKAWKAGMTESGVSTVTYTFPTEVENIAAFIAANSVTNSTPYHITGNLTFVYRKDANMYVQDETGGLMIYDNGNIITEEYVEGDVIQGIYGTYTLYYGLSEMVPLLNTEPADENIGEITPEIATIEDIKADYQAYESKLVRINEIVFKAGSFNTTTITGVDITQDDDQSMQARNVHKTLEMTITEGTVGDIIGFVSRYNTTFQIAPRDHEDVIIATSEQVATPTFSPEEGEYTESVEVTISCTTPNVRIYYTTDGSEPTEDAELYTTPITLTTTTTLKAKAFKEDMLPSVVATAVFDIGSGIGGGSLPKIQIYPVPVHNTLFIESGNFKSKKIEIFSYNGQILYTNNNPQVLESVNVQHLSMGIYFVRISSANEIIVKKFVKQ